MQNPRQNDCANLYWVWKAKTKIFGRTNWNNLTNPQLLPFQLKPFTSSRNFFETDQARSKRDEKKRPAIYDEEEKQESDSKGRKPIFERIKKNPKLLPPPETKESDIKKRIKLNNNKDEK